LGALLLRMADRRSAPDEKSFHSVANRRGGYYGAVFEIKKEIPNKAKMDEGDFLSDDIVHLCCDDRADG
jgi:hypothetical protein